MPLTINFLEDCESFSFNETVFQMKIPLLDKNLTLARDKKAAETLIFFLFAEVVVNLIIPSYENYSLMPIQLPTQLKNTKCMIIIKNTFPCQLFPSEAVDVIK